MAEPSLDDVLTAKVDLTVYTDAACAKIVPPIPPGLGYKKEYQYPGRRVAKEQVGLYKGIGSDISYKVEFELEYRVVPNWPKKPYTVQQKAEGFVKRSEVTGYWDVDDVDSPFNDPNAEANKELPETNNTTNYLLGGGVLAALYLKFRK